MKDKNKDLVDKILSTTYYDSDVLTRYDFNILDSSIIIKAPNFILYSDMLDLLKYDLSYLIKDYKLDKDSNKHIITLTNL